MSEKKIRGLIAEWRRTAKARLESKDSFLLGTSTGYDVAAAALAPIAEELQAIADEWRKQADQLEGSGHFGERAICKRDCADQLATILGQAGGTK